MKLIPVMTEKSMKLTKEGGFTFWVPMNLNKLEIRKIIEDTYSVNVTAVRTINLKPSVKKNAKGKNQKIKAGKKAMVFLKDGQKIDVFEEEKKVKKTRKVAKK